MSRSRDYYDILGVSRTASDEEIRRAYRKLARTYHPDVNKEPDAAKRFAEVTEAYDVLADAEKRKNYDRFGHAGVGAGHGPGEAGGFRPGGRATWTSSAGGPGGVGGADFGDVSEIFEQMFRGRGSPFGAGSQPGAGPTASQPRPRRGEDIHHTLSVTFLTAALGGTEQLRLGSNAASGDSGAQTIDVKIPAGIEHDAKLRIKGRGHPGSHGGQRGDLILTVKIGQHPYFRREGLDLLVDVPINLAEAALGTTVDVPLLKGSAQVKVPPGASSGRKMRIKQQGITDSSGRSGDLFAVVQIVAPATLTEKARSLLEDLQGELENPRDSSPIADTI